MISSKADLLDESAAFVFRRKAIAAKVVRTAKPALLLADFVR